MGAGDLNPVDQDHQARDPQEDTKERGGNGEDQGVIPHRPREGEGARPGEQDQPDPAQDSRPVIALGPQDRPPEDPGHQAQRPRDCQD